MTSLKMSYVNQFLMPFLAVLVFVGSGFGFVTDNNELGLPECYGSNFQIVDRLGFCIAYCEEHEQAAWVCYKLTKQEVMNCNLKRTNNFRPDIAITTQSAQLVDYQKSGYDRGHLAPAGDMAWSSECMSDSFCLSNISPQEPGFNRGIWKNLEQQVRTWAIKNEELYIITGPLLTADLKRIGPSNVSVPYFFYKVILDYHEPERKGIAFLIPNKSSSEPIEMYVKSIDEIELVTGFDFFKLIPDEEETKLECIADYNMWTKTDSNTISERRHKSGELSEMAEIVDSNNNLSGSIYWISANSGVRHNSSCRWYKKSKGAPALKTQGKACKLCGG